MTLACEIEDFPIILFRTIDTQQSRYNSFYERSSKRSINIPIVVSHKTRLENTQVKIFKP